jgi:glucokinase
LSEVVAVDVGGTHARFAIAELAGGRVVSLGEPCTLNTAEHAGLRAAWAQFGERSGRPLPPSAAIAVAGPVRGETVTLTNNRWTIRPARIAEELGADRHLLINDFGAVAHAVAQLDEDHFSHLCGPDSPLPREGVISIVGPGTGLGVAQVLRRDRRYHVVETEGGHTDFAPLDGLDDRILAELRKRHGRVSVERVASGPGLADIYATIAEIDRRPILYRDQRALWQAALAGEDRAAAAAFDRFCLVLGAVAGDIALAHGAEAVVIAGGLGQRLADRLPGSGFRGRFIAKGRFERRMDQMPVKLITHPQPGLFGAAAAFAAEYGE